MTRSTARYIAAAAAAVTAILYFLIGFEVLWIGESASAQDAGLLGFGLTVGTVFAVAALLLLLIERRAVWVPVALLQVPVIIGYFALAGIRIPSFEIWGLTIKALQLVILVALVYLIVSRASEGQELREARP
jgi:hypothetical protein